MAAGRVAVKVATAISEQAGFQASMDRGQTGHPMNVLRDFLLRQMRMSHIYQPIMLKTLLLGSGKAVDFR
jgi:hypothetical protein